MSDRKVAAFMRILAICLVLALVASGCGRREDAAHGPDASAQSHGAVTDPWKADSLAYIYWGSPASPHRDEERYLRFLDALLASDSLPDALRERAEGRRRMAMLNRPGSIAADFRFLERHGGESSLHDLKSPLTLLVFYDPECPHCGDILSGLASSRAINAAVAEKRLTVIAVYAEGKRDVWDRTRSSMPANWLVGYDLTGVLDEELYDLPAMPTPYLLDGDKRVLLKDPPVDALIRASGITEIHD